MGYEFSDWIENDGKGMPVPAETFVLVRLDPEADYADETFDEFKPEFYYTAGFWNGDGSIEESNWLFSAGESSIMAYRIGKEIVE